MSNEDSVQPKDEEGEDTPDLQWMLPLNLRSRWCVVPRYGLYQLFGIGALLGAGIGVTVAGWVLGAKEMTWALGISFLAAIFTRSLLLGVERKYEAEAKMNQKPPESTT